MISLYICDHQIITGKRPYKTETYIMKLDDFEKDIENNIENQPVIDGEQSVISMLQHIAGNHLRNKPIIVPPKN